MQDAISSIQNNIFAICAIAVLSALMGYLVVGKLAKAMGASRSTSMLVGKLSTVILIAVASTVYIQYR